MKDTIDFSLLPFCTFMLFYCVYMKTHTMALLFSYNINRYAYTKPLPTIVLMCHIQIKYLIT